MSLRAEHDKYSGADSPDSAGETAARTSRCENPVFVVGMPRSGTTLLAAMLSGHSSMRCGPETHFFRRLHGSDRSRLVDPASWPGPAIAFLESLEINGQAVLDAFSISVEDVARYLRASPPSLAAILESITGQFAAAHGKRRWVEKTPNHILHLDEIRREFPGARILRVLRDPRDVALSMRQLPWTSDHLLPNLYLWEEWDRLSWEFFERDTGSMTVRYESLAMDPGRELGRVCDFLGERLEASMLDTAVSGRALVAQGEFWKASVSAPVDPSRVGVWRRDLDPDLRVIAEQICSDGIKRYGYPSEHAPTRTYFALPWSRGEIEDNVPRLLDLAHLGVRILSAAPNPNDSPYGQVGNVSDLVLVACPERARTRTRHLAGLLRLSLELVRRRRRHPRARLLAWNSKGSIVCSWMLRALCRPVSSHEL